MRLFAKTKPRAEEFARSIEWSPQWDTGAPMPQVFSNGRRVFLSYLIQETGDEWDGTDVNVIDNTSEAIYSLALVEFTGNTFRFGIANDEVFSGLPLWGKGLEPYGAHTVENSAWIEELKSIHKVHRHFNEARWEERKHFLLLFHDEIFEVIATSYKTEVFKTTFTKLATEVARRMHNI